MEEFHSCDLANTEVHSFRTKAHRTFSTRSPIPVISNHITFKFCCKTISRDLVTDEYSTRVLQDHPQQVTNMTFHHSLRKHIPDVRAMYEAIQVELCHWSFLPEDNRVDVIRKVVGETLRQIKSSGDNNNFIVTVNIHHKHDRVFYENVPRMVPTTDDSIKNLEREMVLDCMRCCSVCMEEMSIGTEATKMPCSHTFHGDCIGMWLKISHYCPLCRYKMPHD